MSNIERLDGPKQILLLGLFTGIYGFLMAGLNVWLFSRRVGGYHYP